MTNTNKNRLPELLAPAGTPQAAAAAIACGADGVYAGWLTRLDGRGAHGEPLPSGAEPEPWPAAVSVGTNPTFDGSLSCELSHRLRVLPTFVV